jgi:hypothetical protein
MKQSIQLLVLLLSMSLSVFAADTHPGKEKSGKKDLISLNTLDNHNGVKVCIKKQDKGPASVTIFDTYGNVLLNDHLPEDLINERNYILEEEGTYIFVISSHHQRIRKAIEVDRISQETILVKN